MRLRITTSAGGKEGKRLREKLVEAKELGEVLEEDISDKDYELVYPSCSFCRGGE